MDPTRTINAAADAGPTAAYRSGAPPGPPPERVRVVLATGPGTGQSAEFYGLLLRRLRVLVSILAVGLALYWGRLAFWTHFSTLRALAAGEPGVGLASLTPLLVVGLPLVVAAAAALALWRRPPTSLGGLRVVELLVIGVPAVALLWVMVAEYGSLEEGAREPSHTASLLTTYKESLALRWFFLVVLYGTLIPNTWRRCVAVVAALGLSPLVLFAALAYWLRPLPGDITFGVLYTLAFWIGLAAALVAFTSHRIEVLRRRANEARKLGQYVLREKLGGGGMGEVYRADHALLRRPAAIKLIRPEKAGDPATLARFEREVQATATLTHPNTVQVYDYGRAEDGTFYYVMEYLPGMSLDELVTRSGPLPPDRAVRLLRQLCGALKEAHAIGLVHRDLKPGNVMVCDRGGVPDTAKLLDFGLVRPAGTSGGEKLTQEGTVFGTPSYLSPEQAGGQGEPDARSDVYSLGALAYFLLTGRPPFAGRSGVKLLAAHLYETPEPPSAHRPGVPTDLEAVVLRCLAKSPGERFQSVDELDAALASLRE